MNKEQFLTDPQQQQIKRNLLKKLIANAGAIISNEVGLPVGCEKMSRIISWLKPHQILTDYPIFEEYNSAVSLFATGKERLECSREALRRYDEQILALNSAYNNRIIDACFEIIDLYGSILKPAEKDS